ncbi:MAG TPA: hypothetical protein VEC38_01595 [Candidatus Binataceae bacterium]|nr:hypothetical protein [Candidatus Binataceae bacterium]
MAKFPSVEFFNALKDRINADPERLRRLGTTDVVLVVKIDHPDRSECFEVTFAAYRCAEVRAVPNARATRARAVIVEGPDAAWREMIENIQLNGQADLNHSLNSLTLLDTPMRVRAANQLDTDLFYRYQQTLQEYFDGAGAPVQ